jgi:hypothetical protein
MDTSIFKEKVGEKLPEKFSLSVFLPAYNEE